MQMNDLRKLTFIHVAVVYVCERESFEFCLFAQSKGEVFLEI